MSKINLNQVLLLFVALSGSFSVLFGAWLAHAELVLLVDDKARLNTAHHYQIIHTLALLTIAIADRIKPSKRLKVSAFLFIIGIICFSGGLYLKTYTGIGFIGKLAPIGGVTLAIAWLSLAFLGKSKL